MQPLFLAGHLGLDYLNTAFALPADGTPVELLGDGEALVAWLLAAGLVDRLAAAKLKRRLGALALDNAAAQARRFRQWAAEFITRWLATPGAEHAADLRRLNARLGHTRSVREIVHADSGLQLVERNQLESADDLLGVLAAQIAGLVTTEAPELVKRCAGPDCVLWFVDRTKAHRRLFCSASACGNRAKVAAFRERKRGGKS